MSSDSDGSENIEGQEKGLTSRSDSFSASGDRVNGQGDTPSPLFRSLSMSQNLAFSVLDEVPHMIRLNALATEAQDSVPTTSASRQFSDEDGDQKYVPSGEFRFYKNKELKVSKSVSVTTPSYQEPKALVSRIPLRRTSSAGKGNDILTGIVVSRWDNIVGPQCSYLWTEEMTSLFYPGNLPKHLTRLIKYVTDHTVDHHEVDGNLVSHSTMKSMLALSPDLNLVYMSLSIRVPSDSMSCEMERPGTTVPHSVAVLASLQYLHHFILMRPLITNWLTEFAPKIGVLLCKNKLHLSMINSWCAELCKTMAAVRTCWWQKTLTEKKSRENEAIIQDTVNVANNNSIKTSIPAERLTNQWDYLPPPGAKGALETMITSHLSTSCSTVVVGPDALAINQVIRFLLCFSKSEEGYCSRYVLPTLPDTFMKGLFVQGLISGEIGEKSISANQLSSNRHPFTHIELSLKCTKVRQMPVQVHQSQREMTLVQELTALWNSTAFVSPQTDLFSHPVAETGAFISKFVTDLQILQPEKRYARLLLFRRMLHVKALGLIAYLQSIQFKPHKEKTLLLKHLKETLCLDESEFLIIQMTAEKIRPGILNILRP